MKLCVIMAAALFLAMQASCCRAVGPKAVGLLEQGQCYKQAGEQVKAFESFADGLVAAIAEGDDRTAMRCAGNISIIYHNFGDVENSLYFAHKGYEMAERLGDGAQVTFLLNFVSFYTNAADTANAAKYYRMLHKAMPMSDNVVTRYFLMYERARLPRMKAAHVLADCRKTRVTATLNRPARRLMTACKTGLWPCWKTPRPLPTLTSALAPWPPR